METSRFEYCFNCMMLVDNLVHRECFRYIGWNCSRDFSNKYACEFCDKVGTPFTDVCLYNRRACVDCLQNMEVLLSTTATRCRRRRFMSDYCIACLVEKGIVYRGPETPSECTGCWSEVEFYQWNMQIDEKGRRYCGKCADENIDERIFYMSTRLCYVHMSVIHNANGRRIKDRGVIFDGLTLQSVKRRDVYNIIYRWDKEDEMDDMFDDFDYYETYMDSPKYVKKFYKHK